jgi:hypothetical protein
MKRRGCTLTDVVVAIGIIACGSSLAAVSGLGPQPGAGNDKDGKPLPTRAALLAKDQQHLRGLGQSMVIWAANNNESFPLPSALDTQDVTIATKGRAKDTTSHIMSILVFNGFVPTDMLVSPVERNRRIRTCDTYQFSHPKGSVEPELALWDPEFSADFTSSKGGHVSYAHLQPAGGRLERWKKTEFSKGPLLATRGPRIREIAPNDNGELATMLHAPRTLSLRFWESPLPGSNEETDVKLARTDEGEADPDRTAGNDEDATLSWTGNILAMDMSIALREKAIADKQKIMSFGRTYETVEHTTRPDAIFFDEEEDPRSKNDFLGIFTRAGETQKEYSVIWD